jgi:radical SAM protein
MGDGSGFDYQASERDAGARAMPWSGPMACTLQSSHVREAATGSRHVFDDAPFIVFWETTQACDLACRHCRADARPGRDPAELSFEEGKRLLNEARAMGCPLVVLTGGDPAKRPDLVDLVRYGVDIGLRVALTPSATPLVTPALLARLAAAGLTRLAVSLDGARAASHDGFRGVEGSFARTLEILRDAREVGLTTQVNTTVTDLNVGELEATADLLRTLEITLWGVFFLVPTGRGETLRVLDPVTAERVLERLVTIAGTAPFDVKTTAAPHFRRVLLQHRVKRREIVGIDDGIGRAPRGVNDGQGIVFVSHRGEVYPSGFLPVPCGDWRSDGLAAVYRDHPTFRALRDADALGGKCGACEFRRVCGGSRARAYATTGDLFAEDPACAYEPPGRGAS